MQKYFLVIIMVTLFGCKDKPKKTHGQSNSIEGKNSFQLKAMCNRGINDACIKLCAKYDNQVYCKMACEKGDKRSCTRINTAPTKTAKTNSALVKELDSTLNLSAAKEYCDKGDESACYELSLSYKYPKGENKSYVELLPGLLNLCKNGNGLACIMFSNAKLHLNTGSLHDPAFLKILTNLCKRTKNLNICSMLATSYEFGRYGSIDIKKALDLYKLSCKKGAGEACYRLANVFAIGKVATFDYREFSNYLKLACKYKYKQACIMTKGKFEAINLKRNNATKTNESQLYDFLNKLCDKGNLKACELFYRDSILSDKKNAKQKINGLEGICKKGYMNSCFYAGYFKITNSSSNRKHRYEKANDLLNTACSGGVARACALQGEINYLSSKKIDEKILLKGCYGGVNLTCNFLAKLYVDRKINDIEDMAGKLFDKGASRGLLRAKIWKVVKYFKLYNLLPDKNYDGINLIKSGCYLKNYEACSILGIFYGWSSTTPNYRKAELYLKRACNKKIINACAKLGELYSRKMTKKIKQAMKYLKIGCDHKIKKSCHIMANIYFTGLGARKNTRKAQKLFKKNCDSGYIESCNMLRVLKIMKNRNLNVRSKFYKK